MSKRKEMDKIKDYDRFLVCDTNSIVLNSPFITDDYLKAFDIAFGMIKKDFENALSSYGVVIYCIDISDFSYPVIRTFVSLGEIIEKMIEYNNLDRQVILDADMSVLKGML